MSDTNPTGTPDEPNADRVTDSRRRVLQALATAAVGVTMLPTEWSKPIVGSIVVPAHAAVSPASPTVAVSQSQTATPPPPSQTATPTPTPSSSVGVSLSRTATPTPTPSRSRVVGRVFGGGDRIGPLGILR